MLEMFQSVWGSIKLGAQVSSNIRAVNIDYPLSTSIVKSSVCDFQAKYADYLFGISSRHMAFKQAIADGKGELEIENLFSELRNYSSVELLGIMGWGKLELKNYFSASRSSRYFDPPSVGIHLIREGETVQRVIPAAHDGSRTLTKPISDYTGFEYVHTCGTPYLDNFTPKTVKHDSKYKHGSLECDAIGKSYRTRWRDGRLMARIRRNYLNWSFEDEEWRDLIMPNAPAGAYPYKSHLIVPITFREHIKTSKIKDTRLRELLGLNGDSRSILGYIAVDHTQAHYFNSAKADSNKNSDANVIYLIADMLSLTLVAFLNFYDRSRTVLDYREEISRIEK